MQHLPPVGWADVANKHDLNALEGRIDLRFVGLEERVDLRFGALEERIDLRFEALEERMALRLDSRIHAEVNRLLLFLFPAIISSLAVAVAVGRMT